LEDYLDERDDPKYYKGSKLDQKRMERTREMERDLEDRRKEIAELDELKAQITRFTCGGLLKLNSFLNLIFGPKGGLC